MIKIGFIEWVKRKMDLTREMNTAKAEALKSYYQSEAYKKAIADQEAKKLKEGKSNDFSSWLKRVSQNAARNLSDEKVTINKKIFGDKR